MASRCLDCERDMDLHSARLHAWELHEVQLDPDEITEDEQQREDLRVPVIHRISS